MNVYNKLDKTKALTNADSYMYYALVSAVPISPPSGSPRTHFVAFRLTYVCVLQEVLWTVLCSNNKGFAAPRAGIDDADPDCGKQICKP